MKTFKQALEIIPFLLKRNREKYGSQLLENLKVWSQILFY